MKVLISRSDSNGDVLLAEPAIRAVSTRAKVDLLVSAQGSAAAELIPRVERILTHQLPWIDAHPSAVNAAQTDLLIDEIKQGAYDKAIILTSFHQSALPLALLMRLAGVPWIAARSEDYPGSLLDLRYRGDDSVHEVERSLLLTAACGFPTPTDRRIRIRYLPAVEQRERPYVVLHPGGTSSSRRWHPQRWRELVTRLTPEFDVIITGSEDELELTSLVAGQEAVDLGGRTSFAEMASVISGAKVLISGNTSAVHVASAVGTPVVLLFSPVVPAERWRPWMVPHQLLGDQQAPCRGTRARECIVPGHPCLNSVTSLQAFNAALELMGH